MGLWRDPLKLIRTACKMDPATFITGDKAFWHCRALSFQLLFTNKCLRRLQLALIGPHIPVLLKESPQTRGVLLHYSNPSLQSSRPPTAPPLKPVRGGVSS
ncbi:hypothetical protein QQF64_003068 [Cirrhinus molitorella]|uniref:Uncharacterized protein n=1 Tax=Cirrhinus molitorella TaxID=172907 RepID=A0ABR3MIZ6_9TELE